MTSRFLTFAAACSFAAGALAPAFAVEIGVVGAVNPDVEGTPPAEPTRVLVTGDALFQNEEIVSGPNGLGYAMFADQTALTIAPNSRVVLDRYVYDPDAGVGEIALSLTRGAVRFIGGRITKSSDAIIKAPTSTIGIRGGVAAVSVSESTEEVLFLAGEYASVSTGGEPVFVSRPGGVITVDVAGGAGPVYAGPAGAAQVASFSVQFDSLGDGGAAVPSAAGEAATAITAANSMTASGVTLDPVSTTGLFTEVGTPFQDVLDITDVQEVESDVSFGTADNLNDAVNSAGFVNVGGDGAVRGQLTWNDPSDLDLHLILPGDAGEVFFGQPVIEFNDGGAIAELDADNLGGTINIPPDVRVENIVVNGVNVPAGTYVFFVDAFSINGVDASAFSLTATGDGGITFTNLDGVLGPGDVSDNLQVIVGGGS